MRIEKSSPQMKRMKYRGRGERNEEQEPDLESKSLRFPPLLTLSDDVLLILLGQLDPRDLINLSRSCQRLNAVARDRTLWSKVDLRNHYMMLCQLSEFIEYLHPTTKFISSKGCLHLVSPSSRYSQRCSPSRVFKDICDTCPSLETFIVEEHYFDARKVSMKDFPSSLKNLTLKTCEVYFLPRDKSYFHGIYKHMANLEVLVLDDCQWLTPHSLMAISKCPNLRELRMKSCRNLGECVVYTSLAARFGFKALKILDVRETSLGDNEICCFNRIDSLSHLLVECPRKRTPNDVDPVKSSEEANGQESRGNELPAGVHCTCLDEADPAHDEPSTSTEGESQDTSEVIVVSLGEGTARRTELTDREVRQLAAFVNDDLPEYLETETLITDRAIMALGTTDIPNDSGVEDSADFITLSYDTPVNSNPNLSHLVINNCKGVTDDSLTYLSKMSSLKYLNIMGTSVTACGIQQFRTRRPDVEVDCDCET